MIMKKIDGAGEVVGGCLASAGCIMVTIGLNLLFLCAILWVLIQVLKNQGVIHP